MTKRRITAAEAQYSDALAINAAGYVVGRSQTASGDEHSILWKDGRLTGLDAEAGGRPSRALAINARGQVAGRSLFPDEANQRATLWSR